MDAGSLLESFLDGELYEARKCSVLAQNLTDVVKGRMKELSLPRYKFVSNVMIGQNADQCISVASRSLWNPTTACRSIWNPTTASRSLWNPTTASRSIWNPTTDNSASATYNNGSLFAVAFVFAVYLE